MPVKLRSHPPCIKSKPTQYVSPGQTAVWAKIRDIFDVFKLISWTKYQCYGGYFYINRCIYSSRFQLCKTHLFGFSGSKDIVKIVRGDVKTSFLCISVQSTVGQHVGVRLEKWNLTKSAGVWHKVPGVGHILLVQWISGEILPHFDIKHIFVAQKMTELVLIRKCLKIFTLIYRWFKSTSTSIFRSASSSITRSCLYVCIKMLQICKILLNLARNIKIQVC